MNRAVRDIREQLRPASHSDGTQEDENSKSDAAHWDCDIHVPPWVSENEANHISARLEGWTKELLQVCWAPSMSFQDHMCHHLKRPASLSAHVLQPHVLHHACGCVGPKFKEAEGPGITRNLKSGSSRFCGLMKGAWSDADQLHSG